MTGAEAASSTQPSQEERITTLVPDPPDPPFGNRDPARRLRVGRGHHLPKPASAASYRSGFFAGAASGLSLVEPYSGEERLVFVIDELMVSMPS